MAYRRGARGGSVSSNASRGGWQLGKRVRRSRSDGWCSKISCWYASWPVGGSRAGQERVRCCEGLRGQQARAESEVGVELVLPVSHLGFRVKLRLPLASNAKTLCLGHLHFP